MLNMIKKEIQRSRLMEVIHKMSQKNVEHCDYCKEKMELLDDVVNIFGVRLHNTCWHNHHIEIRKKYKRGKK